ncbi:DUF4148 domain-containing protein [Roseateles noduli]|uniref:DUF4148 domain-containing protein n=1 Tax=Roseateles noduli TaxID=2052484 RepID=UPI003D64BB91
MQIKHMVIAGLLTLAGFTGAAVAAGADSEAPKGLTRAEVLADLQIYRESGLAAAELPETYGFDTERLREAQTKYQQLRQSPHYAELVRKFESTAKHPTVAQH